MSLKKLRHLDYAVYDNVIVPLLMFNADTWLRISIDEEKGKCRLVLKKRRKGWERKWQE